MAGSREVSPLAAAPILKFLLRLDHPTIRLRRGRDTAPGQLENEIAELARSTGCPIEWYIPAAGGRDEVFYRDVDLVTGADLVLAIFAKTAYMVGGTAHVVEKAIDVRVPAYAFVWDGHLERIGEHDPDNAWGDAVNRI